MFCFGLGFEPGFGDIASSSLILQKRFSSDLMNAMTGTSSQSSALRDHLVALLMRCEQLLTPIFVGVVYTEPVFRLVFSIHRNELWSVCTFEVCAEEVWAEQ